MLFLNLLSHYVTHLHLSTSWRTDRLSSKEEFYSTVPKYLK